MRRLSFRERSALVLGIALAGALTLHVTVRDGVRALAPVFYATPPAVLALGAAAALLLARRSRVQAARVVAGAVLAGAAALVARDVRSPPRAAYAAPDAAPLRGLLWNVQHGGAAWSDSVAWAKALDPDVVWLVEGPRGNTLGARAWREAFPGHRMLTLPGRFAVLARGTAETVRTHAVPRTEARGALVRLSVRGREFESLLVDVPSDPLLDRRPILDRVRGWADARGGAPLLVVGDFNTPPESVGFDAWRASYRDAFASVGRGWSATWPMPFPVLGIDRVWANDGIDVSRCEHGTTSASDHRPVVVEFDVVR